MAKNSRRAWHVIPAKDVGNSASARHSLSCRRTNVDQGIEESTMDLPSLHKAWGARSNTKPFCFFYPFHKRNGITSTRSRGSVHVEIRSAFSQNPREPFESSPPRLGRGGGGESSVRHR